jgi:hypothetical protein
MSFTQYQQDKTISYDCSLSSDAINRNSQEYVENDQFNDKTLSLILSLRTNDQFLIQNQTTDNQRADFRIAPTGDTRTSINDRNRIFHHLILIVV